MRASTASRRSRGGAAPDSAASARPAQRAASRWSSAVQRRASSSPLASRTMRHGTYSIVARDPETGELGAAVQSHWFSVGSLCVWARPGIRAGATQSVVEPAYGPEALDRLADGIGAQQALGELLTADSMASVRQVAVLDARGGRGAHTGADCIVHAGHVTGDHHSAQANMMARET